MSQDTRGFQVQTTSPLPGADLVSQLNTSLAALASFSSGTTAPTTGPGVAGALVLYQLWMDTSLTPAVLKFWNGTVWAALLPSNGLNRVLNGGMQIDQQSEGAAVTVTGTSSYTIDGWKAFASTGGFSVQRIACSAADILDTQQTFYQRWKTTTIDAAPAAGAFYLADNYIEGTWLSDLAWGTAAAQPITISFLVRSSIAGQFGAVVTNQAQNRSYAFTYTINSTNTWEKKTVTIPGDQSGTWVVDSTGSGIKIFFNLGSGSNFLGAAGAWAAANRIGVTGDTKLISTLNATLDITALKLQSGFVATPWTQRTFNEELLLCQRYYEKSYDPGTVPGTNTQVGGILTFFIQVTGQFTAGGNVIFYKATKRASPTLTFYTCGAGSVVTGKMRDLTNGVDVTPGTLGGMHECSWFVSGLTANVQLNVQGQWVADARLP